MRRFPPTGFEASAVNPAERLAKLSGLLLTAIAAASFLLVLLTLFPNVSITGKSGWPEAICLAATVMATLYRLGNQLPFQNVLLAAFIIAFIGGIAHGVGALTGVPFGPISFTGAGPQFFGVLPWSLPFLWVMAVLNSRGVARLILRPWRKLRNYGFWLIGLTAALTVLFDVALEPFATQVKHYWLWLPTKFPLAWHGVPLVNFVGWLLTVLLILAFATPALINKQQRPKQSVPDYHPLTIWLLAFALFGTGAGIHGLWPAAIFCAATSATVSFFAIRGARW